MEEASDTEVDFDSQPLHSRILEVMPRTHLAPRDPWLLQPVVPDAWTCVIS